MRSREQKEIQKAFWERNQLVAFLSKLFPSYLLEHTEGSYLQKGWKHYILIQTPAGQISFHLDEADLPYFRHSFVLKDESIVAWDGHSTEEKFARIQKLDLDLILNWRAKGSSHPSQLQSRHSNQEV